MANMFEMIKQAASMKKEMGKIQKDLERKTVDYSHAGGKIEVVARGDMTIQSIRIDPVSIDPDKAARLEELIAGAINGALKTAKKEAAKEMSKMTGGMGLDGLLG